MDFHYVPSSLYPVSPVLCPTVCEIISRQKCKSWPKNVNWVVMNRRDTPLRISSVDIPLHSLDLFSGGEKKPGILWKLLLMMQLYVARYCTTNSSQFTQRTQNNIPCLSRNWQRLWRLQGLSFLLTSSSIITYEKADSSKVSDLMCAVIERGEKKAFQIWFDNVVSNDISLFWKQYSA